MIDIEVGPSAREILAVFFFRSLGDLYYQLQTKSSFMLGVESEEIFRNEIIYIERSFQK